MTVTSVMQSRCTPTRCHSCGNRYPRWQRQHRQRRQDVHIALAAGQREEGEIHHHETQRQQHPRITLYQRIAPARHQPGQQRHGGQPQRRHHLQVVPGRHEVMPGRDVTPHRLCHDELMEVIRDGRIVARHEPDRQQPRANHQGPRREADEPQQEGSLPFHARPATPHRKQPGQQHKEGKETDDLGQRSETGGKTRSDCPPPATAEQQLAHEAVQRQHGAEHQQGIELPASRHQDELHGEQQEPCGMQAGLAIPQASAEVVHQRERAEARQQRRQQETDAFGPREPVADGLQPEQQRRLVLEEIPADHRDQPVAVMKHAARDQRIQRLIGRPGIAQADAGTDQHQARQQHQRQIAPDG